MSIINNVEMHDIFFYNESWDNEHDGYVCSRPAKELVIIPSIGDIIDFRNHVNADYEYEAFAKLGYTFKVIGRQIGVTLDDDRYLIIDVEPCLIRSK